MFKAIFGGKSGAALKHMSVAALKQQHGPSAPFTLIDVRSPGEYAQDGHIAGARLMPLDALAQRMAELPKDQPVAVICRSGGRSRVACDLLLRAGFADVTNVDGGMGAWVGAGFPVRRGEQ
ncbi:rhodanese-like domain-containing protein [Chloroflexia bacterium SDU3-3]|nr:rhodanese-like domain-containing protein [Chloroflexia bacterium SDU3-3]